MAVIVRFREEPCGGGTVYSLRKDVERRPRSGFALFAKDLADERRPPVVLAIEMLVLFERGPCLFVDAACLVARFVARDPFALEHTPPDLGMEYFVCPIVVMEMCRQRVTGSDGRFVLVALTGFSRHQRLLDGVEHHLPLDRRRMEVEPECEADVEWNLTLPIHALGLEGDRAHHRVARLVPELPGVIAIELPGLASAFRHERRHHLRHIHLQRPLAKESEVALVRGYVGHAVHHVRGELEVVLPMEPLVTLWKKRLAVRAARRAGARRRHVP